MRSQANTAKLLADNPTLMRLRELEVLEKVAANSKLNIVLGDEGPDGSGGECVVTRSPEGWTEVWPSGFFMTRSIRAGCGQRCLAGTPDRSRYRTNLSRSKGLCPAHYSRQPAVATFSKRLDRRTHDLLAASLASPIGSKGSQQPVARRQSKV